MWIQHVTDPAPKRRAELRSLAEARIERRRFYDSLTGLPNRNLFFRRLEAAVAQARPRRQSLAVLALDLDAFSTLNDLLSHAAGDELLRRLAPRLMRSIGIRDTACRTAADDFLVLLTETRNAEAACRVASRLMVALARPVPIAGGSLAISASVGISLFPDHAENAQELLARASDALAEAKREGPASIRVYGEREILEASA